MRSVFNRNIRIFLSAARSSGARSHVDNTQICPGMGRYGTASPGTVGFPCHHIPKRSRH